VIAPTNSLPIEVPADPGSVPAAAIELVAQLLLDVVEEQDRREVDAGGEMTRSGFKTV
jgi:hypothetical protein